jgi:hypothetical protein
MGVARRHSVLLGTVALVLQLTGVPAALRADEDLNPVLARRTGEAMEYDVRSEMDSLRARLEQLERGNPAAATGTCCPSACDCCCCWDPCCRSEGFYAGADLSFLQVHKSSGIGLGSSDVNLVVPGVFGITVPIFNGEIDPGLKETPRVWLGYQNADGAGIRARYWEFDHAFTAGISVVGIPLPLSAFHSFDTLAADLELTDASRIGCNWDMTVSYGARYVEYSEERGIGFDILPLSLAARKEFQGVGPTGSIELRRQVYNDLGFFANFRASALYGDEDNTLALVVGPATVEFVGHQVNDVKYSFESQAGLELITPMGDGGYLFARAGVEAQFWGGFGVPLLAVIADESVGFVGFMLSAGVQR